MHFPPTPLPKIHVSLVILKDIEEIITKAQVDTSQLSKHTAHQHLAMAIKLTKTALPSQMPHFH